MTALDRFLHTGGVIYFALQPLAFPAYAQTLGKLVINDIKALATSQLVKQVEEPIYTIFDEFSVFAGEQIIRLINQGRSAGIHKAGGNMIAHAGLYSLMKRSKEVYDEG